MAWGTREAGAREPTLRDPQQILAYLEELARLRTLVHLHATEPAPLCLGARVETVSEEANRFALSFPHQLPRLEAGQEVELHFPLAGLRFRAPVAFISRGEYMQSLFALPSRVGFAERRGAMRTRIGSREKASAAVFQELEAGVAASGRLINLSMEGLCFRMDRALFRDGDRRVAPQPNLLTTGQKLALVRILNLPHLPTLECGGEVRFCEATSGGPVLVGIRLEGVGRQEEIHLHRFMSRRLPSFGRAFPMRRRHGADGEAEAADVELEAEPDPEELEQEDPSDVLEGEEAPSAEDRLRRIRMRGKRYLVVMPDDLDRSIFVSTMGVMGFPSALEARSLVQALETVKKVGLDALFIQAHVGPLSGVEVARRLRKLGHLEEVPVFILAEAPDVRLQLAAKASGQTRVIGQPVDFDGELRPLLEATFGLREQ